MTGFSDSPHELGEYKPEDESVAAEPTGFDHELDQALVPADPEGAPSAYDFQERGEHAEAMQDTESGSGEGAYQDGEVKRDLREAKQYVELIILDLAQVGTSEQDVVAEVREEAESLLRSLKMVQSLLAAQQSVPSGLAGAVIFRVELVREAAQDAADHAHGELAKVLERVLKRLGRVGRRLLSMNLQLLPVREWSLSGELSALFVRGSISVTFGK
ncbi:MAG: hypothetical protein JO345_34520 [Streptosporangiaceae bacterium]|nr:hypothetical protein [Streptosporangiaceae bacterium]